MQIHELNNFTGTLGAGAYLAIDDGNDTGKISSQGLLAATEARIDNIIAGPAPSAEEIVDARLGADGVTYPSLGDAIRDQFTDVKAELTLSTGFEKIPFTAGGYINCTSTTLPSPSSSLAYSYAKIECSAGDSFTLNLTSNATRGAFAFWDADGNNLFYSTSASLANKLIVAPYKTKWLTVNNADASKISYYGSTLKTLADKTVNDMQAITGLKRIQFYEGCYIPIASGAMASMGTNASYRTALVPCSYGDKFTINASAGSSAKVYGFYDSAFTNLEVGETLSATDLEVLAPQNSAWIVINDNANSGDSFIGWKSSSGGSEDDTNYTVYNDSKASLAQDTSVARITGIADTMNGYTITARFDITSNINFRFGLNNAGDQYSSGYVIVDDTNVEVEYVTDQETFAHGLTFDTFIQISIEVTNNARLAQLVITTLGGQFVRDIPWRASCGRLQLTNLSATAITNVETSYYCSSINKDIWAFGDSYFNLCAQLMGTLGYTNLMLDAKSGRGSVVAFTSLQECLAVRTPSVIYWALGMNDADSGAVNSNWQSTLTSLIDICTAKGIKLILATIPNTPTVDNSYKNAVVKASGYDYVDVCHAVGADVSTSWFTGLLRADNVHPTEQGVNVIVQEWVSVMPFIKE